MLGIALAMYAFDRFGQPRQAPSESIAGTGQPSIAVLPFENRSAREDDAFFVDGVHDDILTSLAKVGSMKVISRTSVEQFEDTELTMPEIGRMLGVTSILEGGVQRAGNRIRINVQLIAAATDDHLWADIYDRELTAENVFAIQSEIAGTIANELRAALTPQEQDRLNVIPTANLEAYESYMLGNQRLGRRTSASVQEAVAYFEEAVSLDPEFALAYVGVADSYSLLRSYANFSWQEVEARARTAAEKAIALDPGLGEAWASLAYVESESGNHERSAELFEKAIALSPNYATAHHWYGELLGKMGQGQQSLKQLEIAVSIDPLSPIINFILGDTYNSLARYDEGEAAFRKALEIDPGFARAYQGLAVLHIQQTGRLMDAAIAARHAIRLDPEAAVYYAILANVFVNLRDAGTAAPWLEQALSINAGHFNVQVVAMSVAALEGDHARVESLAESHLEQFPQSQFALTLLRDIAIRAGRAPDVIRTHLSHNPELSPDGEVAIERANYMVALGLARAYQEIGDDRSANRLIDAVGEFFASLRSGDLPDTLLDDVKLIALQGRTDAALQELERRIDSGWKYYSFYFFDQDTALDSIRHDQRFSDLGARVNADLARQREQLSRKWVEEGFGEMRP